MENDVITFKEKVENWKPFQEVDFEDQTILQYHIDTRDFYCKTNNYPLISVGDKINWEKITKYPERFYFTLEELQYFINRIYKESGEEGEWRMLILDIPRGENWNLKYIRIYRIVNNIFIICNKDSYALKQEILDAKVVTEYLNLIKKEEVLKS